MSDRQLVTLSAAAQREDRLIEVPKALKGRARDAFVRELLKRGLAVEAIATPGQPVWRQDEAGRGMALVATVAALAALGIDEPAMEVSVKPEAANTSQDGIKQLITVVPRIGTKQAQLVAMLSRAEGCSVEEAAKALGWLSHTTRAALTGLRQKGYVIERLKAEDGKGSRHRIVPAAAHAVAA